MNIFNIFRTQHEKITQIKHKGTVIKDMINLNK